MADHSASADCGFADRLYVASIGGIVRIIEVEIVSEVDIADHQTGNSTADRVCYESRSDNWAGAGRGLLIAHVGRICPFFICVNLSRCVMRDHIEN